MQTHGAVASRVMGDEKVNDVFTDWTTADVRPEVKVTLGMLAKLTRQPREFGPADMTPLLEMGISAAGIEHAVIIGGYIFNYQNRMADALGAEVPKGKAKRAGSMLNLMGRKMIERRTANGEMIPYDGVVPEQIQAMVDNVTKKPGDADLTLRQAIFDHSLTHLDLSQAEIDIPESLMYYVDGIALQASVLTDEDVQDLLTAGWSEAEVFEITATASIAAGYGRLQIAWNALAEAQALNSIKTLPFAQSHVLTNNSNPAILPY